MKGWLARACVRVCVCACVCVFADAFSVSRGERRAAAAAGDPGATGSARLAKARTQWRTSLKEEPTKRKDAVRADIPMIMRECVDIIGVEKPSKPDRRKKGKSG